MRIPGFTRLITEEELQVCSLKNCSVVIDGQNYFYNTYEESKLAFVFGCEANEYAKFLKNQLNIFRKANVKCCIVFKGGDTDIENKIKKYNTTTFDIDSNYEFVLPILTKDVYKLVLNEMRIDYAVCVTESKDECEALAQKLRCPIISFDMEFCFRKAPYIPRHTLKYNRITESIECRQYKLQNFLHKHSLTEQKIALIAALTDTLLFSAEYFNSLFQTWGVFNKNPVLQLKQLIIWLSKNSYDKAREDILQAIENADDRYKFCAYYTKILENIRKEEAGIVTEYFTGTPSISRQDPMWFAKGVAYKKIAITYVNLYKWKVLEGICTVEDKNPNDSILLSIDIIKYVYNLLTNFKRDNIKLYQDADNYINIDTGDSIRKPTYKCKETVFENGWLNLRRFKLFEHFLNENKINIEILNKLPADATVLFAALVYFARKKLLMNVEVTKEVDAIIVCYVMLNVIFDTNCREKFHYLQEADRIKAREVTAKYFKCQEDEAKRIFNGSTLKNLVEFNFCMLHMNYLSILCNSVYKPIKYNRIYNGTFVYKMLCDMRERDSDVKELFKTAPSVLKLVKEMINFYKELLKRE